ncbi:PREDICTED: uncharacterized protein LOC107354065 isoform X4 [Acropora digitifera]|uniref:uncharacterized protein LOC107354065 isoform X4 n=1 Tax=Acropora digitifera TaxID=70779 RepID=UPI00077A79EF|nr:PREDICTED: uncharacterized protein LOC107354065 isoform X4 [Acropora digitifera]
MVYKWKYGGCLPQLTEHEAVVSDVIEISAAPEVGGLKFNNEVKVVLSHSAAGLEGYEVVLKRLTDKEKNEWEETAGCDDIRQVSDFKDDYPCPNNVPYSFPVVLAGITECSSYAVVSRLKLSLKYTITVNGGTFAHPCYPQVTITVPQKAVATETRLSLELKVQEVPQDEFQRHDLFCGPILRVLCSSKATFLEPVTIQLPVFLGNKLVNIPQPCDCRVRIFFLSPERETKEWVEISDKLENPASYDGKLVKFKVQRFSGYAFLLDWTIIGFGVVASVGIIAYLSSIILNQPRVANFFAYFDPKERINSRDILFLICCPAHQRKDVKQELENAGLTSREATSRRYMIPGRDMAFVFVSGGDTFASDEDMGGFYLRFYGNVSHKAQLKVLLVSDQEHCTVEFRDTPDTAVKKNLLSTLSFNWSSSSIDRQVAPLEEAPGGCSISTSSRKLKVTLLSIEWGSTKGGLSTINRELAIQLAKYDNVEVCMYLPWFSDEDKKEAADCRVSLLKAKEKPGYDPIDWLASVPQDHQMDIVIGHGIHLGRQVPHIKESHPECKWVQVVHTDPEELGMFKTYACPTAKGEKKREAELKLCKRADQVVAIGPKLDETYSRSCGNEEIHVITPGIFSTFSHIKQNTKERRAFHVLVFGRGDIEDFRLKGYDIAAQAVAKLKDEEHPFKLVFVGAPSGKEEQIKERLLNKGISRSQLIVRSAKEREQLAEQFCQADLVIMPSRNEDFGLIGLEALSAGLPVLISRNSGLGEALEKVPFGGNVVVNSEDPAEWAKAIRGVRSKPRNVRLEEARALRNYYSKMYNWQKQCSGLIGKIHELADAGHHALQMLENYGVEGDNLPQAVQETQAQGTPPSVRRAREYQRDTLQSQSKLRGKFPHFVNRKTDELSHIVMCLDPKNKQCQGVFIDGAPGIGKTILATEAANKLRDDNRHVLVAYIDCKDINSFESFAGTVMEQICRSPSVDDPAAEIKKRLIASNNYYFYIFFLDDFECFLRTNNNQQEIQPSTAAAPSRDCGERVLRFVGEIARLPTNIKFLVTSSERVPFLPMLAMETIHLNPFDKDESSKLLEKVRCGDKISVERSEELCKICSGIPLVLHTLISSQEDLIGLLKCFEKASSEERTLFLQKMKAVPQDKRIEVCLNLCFQRLTPQVQLTLLRLCLYRGLFTPDKAAKIFCSPESSEHNLRAIVLELGRCNLLHLQKFQATNKFTFLTVIREHFKLKAKQEYREELQHARGLLIDYLISFLKETFKVFLGKNSVKSAIEEFSAENENVMQLVEWIDKDEMDEERVKKCIDVFNVAGEMLAKMMAKLNYRTVYESLAKKCREMGDQRRLAECLTSLGIKEIFNCLSATGLSDEAIKQARRFLDEADEIQTHLQVSKGNSRAQCLAKRGRCLVKGDNKWRGKDMIEEAIRIRKAIIDTPNKHEKEGGENVCYVMLGATYNDKAVALSFENRHREAVNIRESEVMPIYRERLGDHPFTATILNNLSNNHRDLGEFGAAEEYAEQALRIRRELLADHRDTAKSLFDLGVALKANKKFKEAKDLLEECKTMQEKVVNDSTFEENCCEIMAQRDKSEPIPIPPRGAGHHAPQMQQNNGVEGDNLPQAVQETTPEAGHRAPQMRENDGVEGDNLPQAVQETTQGTPPSVCRAREYERGIFHVFSDVKQVMLLPQLLIFPQTLLTC